jgi:AcrR family transcriptional regulator
VAPRSYKLGQRADTAAATRERVLAAAGALYRERGIKSTTLQAVAARADVSRGTIVHHFGSGEGLLGAVIDEVVGLVDVPDERVLDGATTVEDRVRRFAGAMLEFYDRTAAWWTVVEPIREMPSMQAREQAFMDGLGRFQATAFGPYARDRLVMAAAHAFVHWEVVGTMRAAGASLQEVIDTVGDALIQVMRRQARDSSADAVGQEREGA